MPEPEPIGVGAGGSAGRRAAADDRPLARRDGPLADHEGGAVAVIRAMLGVYGQAVSGRHAQSCSCPPTVRPTEAKTTDPARGIVAPDAL